jgi:prevent-host-death family protein
MSDHSIAEAQNSVPELIDRALRGEGVVITRNGTPVVELRPIPAPPPPPRPITQDDIDWLSSHRVGRLSATEDAGTLVSRMRDEDWR